MYQISYDCSIAEQLQSAFETLEHLQVCLKGLELTKDVVDNLAAESKPAIIRNNLHLRASGLGIGKLDAVGNLLENYTSEVEAFYGELSICLQRIESMLEELRVL